MPPLERLIKRYKDAIRIGLICCVFVYFIIAIHYGQLYLTNSSEKSTSESSANIESNAHVDSALYFTDNIDKHYVESIKPRFQFLDEFKNPCFLEDISSQILGSKTRSRAVYENNTMIEYLSKHFYRDLMHRMYPAVIKETYKVCMLRSNMSSRSIMCSCSTIMCSCTTMCSCPIMCSRQVCVLVKYVFQTSSFMDSNINCVLPTHSAPCFLSIVCSKLI